MQQRSSKFFGKTLSFWFHDWRNLRLLKYSFIFLLGSLLFCHRFMQSYIGEKNKVRILSIPAHTVFPFFFFCSHSPIGVCWATSKFSTFHYYMYYNTSSEKLIYKPRIWELQYINIFKGIHTIHLNLYLLKFRKKLYQSTFPEAVVLKSTWFPTLLATKDISIWLGKSDIIFVLIHFFNYKWQ